MLGSKYIEKIILSLTAIAVIFAMVLVVFPAKFSTVSNENATEEYPIKLFGKDVINIEIDVDENNWNDMIDNKMSKPYISCDLKVDGIEFSGVGIRPKGNSSLTSSQGDRLSFRVDFDHYIKNQTCYGLEQMMLNNLQADATYMKDFTAFDLMQFQGVNAPLHTYAFLTLNGKPFGVYLALEVYDEDYLKRVYNNTNIMLYSVKNSDLNEFDNAVVDSETGEIIKASGKVEATGMGAPPPPGDMGGPGMPPPPGGMGGPGMPPPPAGMENSGVPSSGSNEESGMQPPEGMGGPGIQPPEGMGGPGMPPPPGGIGGGGGGDLVYVDDSTESYNTIFGNAVSKNANAKDFAKVIKAIKYLNKENVTNEELEKYWDVDSILRYLAVHTFMVNGDSYIGGMKQNYYIAEDNGKLSILPWDYNLSFGSFGGPPPGGMPPGMGKDAADGKEKQPDMMNFTQSTDETTNVINFAIDTPLSGVEMKDRPLVHVLFGREEYKRKYHQYLEELVKYTSGDFIDRLEMVENSIYPYIQKETVAFYSPEEHVKAFDTLKKLLKLRSESIQGQLKGEIPSVTDEQKGAKLITGDFSIKDLGSMGGPPGENGDRNMMPPPFDNQKGDMKRQETPSGDNKNKMPTPPGGMGGVDMPPPPGGFGGGGMQPPPGMPGMNFQQNNTECYVTLIVSLLVLFFVFLVVKLYKRKF